MSLTLGLFGLGAVSIGNWPIRNLFCQGSAAAFLLAADVLVLIQTNNISAELAKIYA